MKSFKKKILLFASILLASLFLITQCVPVRAAIIRVPQDYPTIQQAINAASVGDTVSVSAGVYYEHLTIPKPITLIGANSNTTIIDGNGTGIIVSISVNSVTLSNFTIRNTEDSNAVSVSGSSNTISGNRFYDNQKGIVLFNSNNNTLYRNTFFKTSSYGIMLYNSSNNKIYHNNFMVAVNVADNRASTWDNGLPSGGNYWVGYTGVDNNHDGIGDTPYVIDADSSDRYPLMQPRVPYGEFRDVGITDFAKSKKSIPAPGGIVVINVTVFNYGTLTENPSITVYYDSTPIQTKVASNLLKGDTAKVTFNWNTTGVPLGKYTISASITSVPNDMDTTDNNYTDDRVRVGPIPGDIDSNGVVDIYDIVIVAAQFGRPPPPITDPRADVNGDGVVDIFDIVKVAADFGETLY